MNNGISGNIYLNISSEYKGAEVSKVLRAIFEERLLVNDDLDLGLGDIILSRKVVDVL